MSTWSPTKGLYQLYVPNVLNKHHLKAAYRIIKSTAFRSKS